MILRKTRTGKVHDFEKRECITVSLKGYFPWGTRRWRQGNDRLMESIE